MDIIWMRKKKLKNGSDRGAHLTYVAKNQYVIKDILKGQEI